MGKDEYVSKVLGTINSVVIRGHLNTSSIVALGLVELRTRMRSLDQMLEGCGAIVTSAMSEALESLEYCESIIADQRGAFDYECGQVRHAVTNELDQLLAASVPVQHALNDPAVRQQVHAMTGGKCTYCGTAVSDTPEQGVSVQLIVEHVVPASKGGPNNLVNYVPACGSCNSAKGDRHVLHFVRNVQPLREKTAVVIPMTGAQP